MNSLAIFLFIAFLHVISFTLKKSLRQLNFGAKEIKDKNL